MKSSIILSFLLFAFLNLCNKTADKKNSEVKEATITNLYDAFGKDTILTKDFGFSCITKYKGKTILFDAGSNADIFKENTTNLGIDLSKVDIVIVSHGHFDHLNGLDYVLKINPKVKIYFPYDIFWGAPVPFDATGQETAIKDSLPTYMQYFDGGNTKFSINQSGRFWNANIEFVKTSKEILPDFILLQQVHSLWGTFRVIRAKALLKGNLSTIKTLAKTLTFPNFLFQ